MTVNNGPPSPADGAPFPRLSLRRLAPLLVLVVVSVGVIAFGWHRQLSFEEVARHHEALGAFIARHELQAVTAYIALYVTAAALSIPVGFYLTVIGGILFGTVLGGAAALVGATTGAICIFLIARSAIGEYLVRRAGPLAGKLAQGFCADAFSYLLFLRLVPIVPFWMVNLVAALCGVRFATFAAATALGIIPATFIFAFLGAGLDSVITAQQAAYHACVAAARPDCRLQFHLHAAVTPELIAALVALSVLALGPVVVKHLRGRAR